jgi:hypothetical protein
MNTGKITKLALIATAPFAATIALAATAHADIFQSPPGDVVCKMSTGTDGAGEAFCDIGTNEPPPYALECEQRGQFRVSLHQGSAPITHCELDSIVPGSVPRNRGLGTLAYGETASAGTIACDSEPSGMTCTDSSTGHFFRVSAESYQFG